MSRKRIESGIAKGAKNPRAKRIMCVETGVIFEYQQEASDLLGLRSMASINHALKQRRFVAGGYHFVTGDDIERLDTEEKRKQYLIEVEEESRLARQRALNNPEYQGKS